MLIGGTMGTCSYVLTGTQAGMEATFGSTCHGAVSDIIQIWTCDEGNMEFYGSETIILTKAKARSILLLKIRKTHLAGWCLPLV